MSNQYKLEIQFATKYGQDGNDEAWAFLAVIQKAIRGTTPQINYLVLAKEVNRVWHERYPRNKDEFDHAVKYGLQQMKARVCEELLQAQRIVDVLKQELEALDEDTVSDALRSKGAITRDSTA